MRFSKYFGMAFEALVLNKVRSALTMLGMIIGVFSVIVMIGMGQGSQAYITEQVRGLGAGVLIVTPGNPKTQKSFGPPGTTTAMTLTLNDARALESIPGISYVSPNAFIQAVLKVDKNAVGGMVLGTSPSLAVARGFKLRSGRFFNDQEARTGARVIVLGRKLAQDLFVNTLREPLGDKVRIEGQRFRVIGVLEEQGGGLFGSTDEQAIMPTRTFQSLLKGGERINSIFIKSGSDELLPVLQNQVSTILRQRHAIRPDEDSDFKIQTQSELLSTIGVVTSAFTILLAGIAAISLLVGGIGIMNIMLVSVTERTREIGIRKALGARHRDILAQFLLESATISLAGGTLGILLGLLATFSVARLVQLPFVFSSLAVCGAFVFSAAVGVFFGAYPANQAARLDPVDALRYE